MLCLSLVFKLQTIYMAEDRRRFKEIRKRVPEEFSVATDIDNINYFVYFGLEDRDCRRFVFYLTEISGKFVEMYTLYYYFIYLLIALPSESVCHFILEIFSYICHRFRFWGKVFIPKSHHVFGSGSTRLTEKVWVRTINKSSHHGNGVWITASGSRRLDSGVRREVREREK